jgi:hypothetical protein
MTMTALTRPAVIVNDRPVLSSERMLQKDYTVSIKLKKLLVVSLKGLVAKTN